MGVMAGIEANGFAFIPSYMPGMGTINAVSTIGEILELNEVNLIQTLTPKEIDRSTPNTYSGIYGLDEFPMHTDLAHWDEPPRYLVLRCIVGTPLVKTRLIDFRKLAERIGNCELRRLLVQPRRSMNGRRSLKNVLEIKKGNRQIYRWDSVFIEPATKISEGAYLELKEAIGHEESIEITLERPGDTVVIDNWRMLHGRSPVPDMARERRIERVYMGKIKECC